MSSRETVLGRALPVAVTGAGIFGQFDNSDVRALIGEYPLAWVSSLADENAEPALLPLVGVYDEDGFLVELIGHCARSNPLHAALAVDPRALLLFRGPEAYISPEHAGRRNWGPTWNYAQLIIKAEIVFDIAQTESALDVLIEAVESGRAEPWQSSELGERYYGMLGAIIGFRARVTGLKGKFKLGQDEAPETLRSILARLPDQEMCKWMRRFNKGRE